MNAKSTSRKEALRAHPGIAAKNQPSNSHWLDDIWPIQIACLCCSNTFNPAQCSSYPLHSTVYCTSCWHQHTNKCKTIKQTIITLQRRWRGITHSVYHTTPAPTPGKERRQLQALTASSTSPTNYSPLTPQHYSQYSNMHFGSEASPIMSTSGGLEQASTQQISAGQSSVNSQSAARGPRRVGAEADAQISKARAEEVRQSKAISRQVASKHQRWFDGHINVVKRQ